MAARGRSKKQETREDAADAQVRVLAGVDGLLMRLNLAPQALSFRVYEGRELPTTALHEPFGATVTPPAEAMHVGRILKDTFDEEQLHFFLTSAAGLNVGHRTSPRSFAGGYLYFFTLAQGPALRPRQSSGMRGCWAAIALGSRSLLRWTGGVLNLDDRCFLDPKWGKYFGSEVAALAADLVDGAVEPGSGRLAEGMRELAQGQPAARKGRKLSSKSHRHYVEVVLGHRRGSRMTYVEIGRAVRKHFEADLSVEQIRAAVRRIPDAQSGTDPTRWACLP